VGNPACHLRRLFQRRQIGEIKPIRRNAVKRLMNFGFHAPMMSFPMGAQCCPNTPFRKMARSIHEKARELARSIATTWEYQQSCCERKKVEMLIAHLKRILRLDRLRLRGLSGARDELLLAAIAQKLRRMAKQLYLGNLNLRQRTS
jgi:hypothetical protein